VVAAGILHDNVEDSPATIEDFERRKASLRRQIAASRPEACAVFAADKVAKVRELRSRATRGEDVLDPHNVAAHAKLQHYPPA